VPAVPEQPDGGLVPPVKVLRKRLNGVYRADGFSGPTRRYVLVVALLVGLASLPTLAAITAGTHELDRDTTGAMDVPFLPPASSGPVVPARPAPAPSFGVVHGQAGKRRTLSHRYGQGDVPASGATARAGQRWSASASGRRRASTGGAASSRPARSGRSAPPTEDAHRDASPPNRSPRSGGGPVPAGHAVPPSKPARPADPDDEAPPLARPPFCHERGKCGVRESRHHRPDWSRHRQCENATHRARWSHHREGRPGAVAVAIVPTGRHGARATIRERPTPSLVEPHFQHTRRSMVTERPSNVRPPRWGDRTHNSRRHEMSRWDDGHRFSRSYRGAHRADDLEAHDRSSRVGRHHAGRDHESSGGW
jgi:hypothetical protein